MYRLPIFRAKTCSDVSGPGATPRGLRGVWAPLGGGGPLQARPAYVRSRPPGQNTRRRRTPVPGSADRAAPATAFARIPGGSGPKLTGPYVDLSAQSFI
ncbi:hypothetical protein MTP06_41280 [Streptomyces sp. PLM4]|nr:hypothetical protein MTP06_41280 [Streptomyces sp. PLM4]